MNALLYFVWAIVIIGIYDFAKKLLGAEPNELSIREDCRRFGLVIVSAGLLGVTLHDMPQSIEDLKLAMLMTGVGALFVLLGNMKYKP